MGGRRALSPSQALAEDPPVQFQRSNPFEARSVQNAPGLIQFKTEFPINEDLLDLTGKGMPKSIGISRASGFFSFGRKWFFL
jgi:hypothetical protein